MGGPWTGADRAQTSGAVPVREGEAARGASGDWSRDLGIFLAMHARDC
jgi:hypothetical protein